MYRIAVIGAGQRQPQQATDKRSLLASRDTRRNSRPYVPPMKKRVAVVAGYARERDQKRKTDLRSDRKRRTTHRVALRTVPDVVFFLFDSGGFSAYGR